MKPDISHLLVRVSHGETDAHNELFTLVYDQLRRIARTHVGRSGRGLTLNPTTLVHEAWIKFSRAGSQDLKSSAHFYNIVALAMRQIIHNLAEAKATEKRGHGLDRVELSDEIEQKERSLDELIAIDAALGKLHAVDDALGEIAHWHYFAGLTVAEIANLRSVSERTVKRQLAMARVFLLDALRGAE